MRSLDVNLTSIILRCFILLELLPIAFSCIYLLNGWMPMSVFNRTSKADVVLSAHVIKTFKDKEHRTEAQTYTATVKLIDVYKGQRLLRTIPVNPVEPNVYNVTNFGDRKMCYADVMDGKNYILFLTTYKQRLSAKYDDIFGAATKFTENNVKDIKDQIGSGFESWSGWSSCSRSCGGGEQVRKRECKTPATAARGHCDTLAMDKRACNMFVCDGVHDLLDYLGVYKLPLGVYHVHERPGAFNITGSAKLNSLFSSIYTNSLPQDFSVLVSVNFSGNFSGYFFTLSDLMGKHRIATKYSRGKKSDSLTFEFYDNQGYPGDKSPVFEFELLENAWHQFAIAVNGNTVDLYIDCEAALTKTLGRKDFTTLSSNLMMSLGPYFARYGATFEGEIEQLAIVDDPDAATRHCSPDYTDGERAIKDEENNEIEVDDDNNAELEGNKSSTQNATAAATHTTTAVEAVAAMWTEWSACSRSCGRGVQTRTRYCGNDIISSCVHAGLESEQIRWCNLGTCRVGCQPRCENGGVCSSNKCTCPSGYIGHTCGIALCTPDCANGGRCTAPGQCTCPVGYTGRYCETAICTPKCGNGGRCIQPGYCSCPYGYMPPSCEPICILPCRNGGRCVRHDKCRCRKGYTGRDCSQPICRRGCFNGGRCVAPNTCTCPRGYGGSRCHKPICFPACKNKGRCLYPGICHCKRGYAGPLCESVVCKKPCQNGGICTGNNTCACPEGFRGRWCHKTINKRTKCRMRCFNGGRCRKKRCRCKPEFTGPRCEKRLCKYETLLKPYTQTYKRLERHDVATQCGPWKWKTCLETRQTYVTATRTLYRTAYRCA